MTRVTIDLTSLVLPPDCGIIRNPTRDPALRHADFWDRYDADTVIFDLFRTQDPGTLLAICPPLHNLIDDLDLRFRAEPSGTSCTFRKVTRINVDRLYIDVPPGTDHIVAETSIGEFPLRPSPDMTERFRDKRVAFTLSKDNDLVWIRDWAAYYARVHGADAVVVYDNGSTRYDVDELARALETVPELESFAIVPWPFRYGPADYRRTLTTACGDCDYCQRGSMEHAATRLLSQAAGVVNVDVDELIFAVGEKSLFEALEQSGTGYLHIDGVWIEAVPDGAEAENRHAAYWMRAVEGDPEKYVFKWVIDPRRNSANVQWQIHGVHPASPDPLSIDFRYGHFRAINTNWDLHRVGSGSVLRTDTPEGSALAPVPELRDALRRAFPNGDDAMIATRPVGDDPARFVRTIEASMLKPDETQVLETAGYWNQRAFLTRIDPEENPVQAIELSEKAVASAPGNFHFLATLLGSLYDAGRLAEGDRAIWTSGFEWDQQDRARLLAIEAFLRWNAGDDRALESIDAAIRLRPGIAGYHLMRGRVAAAANNIASAEDSYRTAIRLAESEARIATEIEEIARRTYAVGVFDFSDRPFFIENIAADQPWRSFAEFLLRQGRNGEAVEVAREVVKRCGLSTHSHTFYIRCLEAAGDTAEDAKRDFLKLVRVLHDRGPVTEWQPEHKAKFKAATGAGLITALIMNGQVTSAVPLAYQLLDHDPLPLNEIHRTARALLDAGEIHACEALVSELILRAPGDVRFWNSRIDARRKLGNLVGVRADVTRAAEIEPNAGQPWSTLGLALRENGQRDEALAAFAEAIRREPTEIRFHMQRIWTLMGCGEVEQALDGARAVVARFPDDHRGHLALAKALNRVGAQSEALAAARRTLELKPDLDEARQLADQLSA